VGRKKTLKPAIDRPKDETAAPAKVPGNGNGNGNGGGHAAAAEAARPEVAPPLPDDTPGLKARLLEAEARRAEMESVNERLRGEIQKLRVEVAELRAQIDLVASADPVSGAANRRAFMEVFRREWQRSRRYGRSLSVIMADIDQFKAINDGYGTEVGDRILRLVAQAFRKFARATDIIGRYGGDSFAIVLPESDLAAARRVAERLRKGLENAVFEHKGRPILVTSSFGVACAEDGDPEPEALLLRADDCLYQAKRAGRNLVIDDES
jgi:diguanylate cyclase (GGDEF)-like protein